MMLSIKGGSVNYGNGNALSIALLIFSYLLWSVLNRTSWGKRFKLCPNFIRISKPDYRHRTTLPAQLIHADTRVFKGP